MPNAAKNTCRSVCGIQSGSVHSGPALLKIAQILTTQYVHMYLHVCRCLKLIREGEVISWIPISIFIQKKK